MSEFLQCKHSVSRQTTVRCPNYDCMHIFTATAYVNASDQRDAHCPACGKRVSGRDLMWGIHSPDRAEIDCQDYVILIRTLVAKLKQDNMWVNVRLAQNVLRSLERACGEWPSECVQK